VSDKKKEKVFIRGLFVKTNPIVGNIEIAAALRASQ